MMHLADRRGGSIGEGLEVAECRETDKNTGERRMEALRQQVIQMHRENEGLRAENERLVDECKNLKERLQSLEASPLGESVDMQSGPKSADVERLEAALQRTLSSSPSSSISSLPPVQNLELIFSHDSCHGKANVLCVEISAVDASITYTGGADKVVSMHRNAETLSSIVSTAPILCLSCRKTSTGDGG